jgi:hypothetical protein
LRRVDSRTKESYRLSKDQETEVKQVFHGCPYATEGVTGGKILSDLTPPHQFRWSDVMGAARRKEREKSQDLGNNQS